jgi:diguanylate cyclase
MHLHHLPPPAIERPSGDVLALDPPQPRLPPLADMLDLVADAICVVDAQGHFLFVSASFERILGYARDEVIGRRTFEFVHPDDRTATMAQAEKVMGGALQRHFRNRYLHKDGHTVDMQWSARWHVEYGVRIAVGREVTELRVAERQLEHLASHDPLTGLPNRHRLHLELRRALAHAEDAGEGLALLYVDLDGFKSANDRGGHDAGDRVLREVSSRFAQVLREGDLVARIGGDEFVVLLPGCRDADTAHLVGEALRARLRPAHALADGPLELDASIGVACFPTDGRDPDALLAHADQAMYVAKRGRRQASS